MRCLGKGISKERIALEIRTLKDMSVCRTVYPSREFEVHEPLCC